MALIAAMKTKKAKVILALIFLLSLALRVVGLKNYPAGFTADEAAQGYTAYSLLKTGRDEWGVRLPVNPRSFGDFKAPLYTYLAIPGIALFGLNEFAVRLPGALLGALTVLAVYWLCRELFGDDQLKDGRNWGQYLPAAASLLLAISPWHISLSRGAFEANLTTFFLPLGTVLFLKGLRRPKLLILASLVFSLNLFTYHSAKLVTPLILFFLILWKKSDLIGNKKGRASYLLSLAILSLAGLVMAQSFFFGAGTRAADIQIFSGGEEAVFQKRLSLRLSGMPDIAARIFCNKIGFYLTQLQQGYFAYLSPYFLFGQGAGEATYGMYPGRGLLYLIELPFLLTAFYLALKERKGSLLFLWFWLVISPLPASLARGVGFHANRVAVMMPAIQILSAFGAVRILMAVKKRYLKFCLGFFILSLALSWVLFLEGYFFELPKSGAPKMSYGWRELVLYLKKSDNAGKRLIISRSLSEPQAFLMFYLRLDPKTVQRETPSWLEYQTKGYQFVDRLDRYSLGNAEIRRLAFPEDLREENALLIGRPEDFELYAKIIEEGLVSGKIRGRELIYFPDGRAAFYILETL